MISVFFDMDGTLIDSANATSSAVNGIRAELKLNPSKREDIIRIINTLQIDWVKELCEIENFSHSSFKEGFEEYFIKHYQQSVVLFEDVKEILDLLKEQKCYLAVATDAPQSPLTQILNKHNILPYFDKVLGVSVGIEPKPSLMMLHLLKEEAPYQTSFSMGDSAKDKEATQRANIPYYHAKWYEKDLEESELSNARELLNPLKNHL